MKTERSVTPRRIGSKQVALSHRSPARKDELSEMTRALTQTKTVQKEATLPPSKFAVKAKLEFLGSLNSTQNENEKDLKEVIEESKGKGNQAEITEVAIHNVQI